MSAHPPIEKILSFPKANSIHEEKMEQKKLLHPSARRRRLLWLVCIVGVIVWFLLEMVIQQFRIWDRQDRLARKQHEIVVAEKNLKGVKASIQRLQSEDYLLELAHKLGYSFPGEENYQLQGTDSSR